MYNHVFLEVNWCVFATRTEAEAAAKALNGRWFGGRMIKAELYDQDKFEANDLSH